MNALLRSKLRTARQLILQAQRLIEPVMQYEDAAFENLINQCTPHAERMAHVSAGALDAFEACESALDSICQAHGGTRCYRFGYGKSSARMYKRIEAGQRIEFAHYIVVRATSRAEAVEKASAVLPPRTEITLVAAQVST